MRCGELDRWLDDGMPESGGPAAHAHATSCARCAAAMRAALEIDSLLAAAAAVPAPAGFSGRVMARVASANEAYAHAPLLAPSPVAWWIRAAAEPTSALAMLLAGLMLWKGEAIISITTGLTLRLAHALTAAPVRMPTMAAPFHRPDVVLGMLLAAAPTLAWAAWVLYHWTERMVLAPAARIGRVRAG
jgi:hypothetical protein